MAEGPERGLALIDAIDGLDGYHLLHSARADLLRRLGRSGEAAAAYRQALALTANRAEREFLEARLAECEGRGPSRNEKTH
jgi:RNA polymerase sigma-70 factor (ECF subfamily)